MVRLSRKLTYDLGKNVFYIDNHKDLNIIEHFVKDAECEHETTELLLVEQHDIHYLFGATTNSNYVGFMVNKEDFLNSKNKYSYFDRYFL